MIKASELRIGNLFLDNGKVREVLSLSEDIILADPRPEIGLVARKVEYVKPHDAQGIPLSEEWLRKLGFVDTNNGYRATGAEVVYELPRTGRPIRLWWDYPDAWTFESWNNCKVQYVHQLQNLYFALTGEELTIKEIV